MADGVTSYRGINFPAARTVQTECAGGEQGHQLFHEGVAPQLAAHKQGAVNMGNSQQLVDELSAWLSGEGYTLSTKWCEPVDDAAYNVLKH